MKRCAALLLLGLVVLGARRATAQPTLAAEPQAGYDLDEGDAFAGVGFWLSPDEGPFLLGGSASYWPTAETERILRDGSTVSAPTTILQLNLSGKLLLQVNDAGLLTPYAGGGLTLRHTRIGSVQTDLEDDLEAKREINPGFHALGGAFVQLGGFLRPFAQVRLTVSEQAYTHLMGGVLVRLGFF